MIVNIYEKKERKIYPEKMDCYTRSVSPIIGRQVIYNLNYPKPFRKQALEACHDEIGHLGIEKNNKSVEG